MMINTIAEFVESRGTNLHELAVRAGVSPSTLYRLRKNTHVLPDGKVMNGIFKVYPDATPNDLIRYIHVEDES